MSASNYDFGTRFLHSGPLQLAQADRPSTITAEQYADYSRAQRVVALYMYLLAGHILRPSQYAEAVGTSRYCIYRQKRILEGMSVPIVQIGAARSGEWALKQFAKPEKALDRIWNDAHK